MHLSAACWVLMLRRTLCSNPSTWALLEPKVVEDLRFGLQGCCILGVRQRLQAKAGQMGVTLAGRTALVCPGTGAEDAPGRPQWHRCSPTGRGRQAGTPARAARGHSGSSRRACARRAYVTKLPP